MRGRRGCTGIARDQDRIACHRFLRDFGAGAGPWPKSHNGCPAFTIFFKPPPKLRHIAHVKTHETLSIEHLDDGFSLRRRNDHGFGTGISHLDRQWRELEQFQSLEWLGFRWFSLRTTSMDRRGKHHQQQ
jgi:hypothetical protein